MRTPLIAVLLFYVLVLAPSHLAAQEWPPRQTINGMYPLYSSIRHPDGRLLLEFRNAAYGNPQPINWVDPSELLGVIRPVESFPTWGVVGVGDINGDGIDDLVHAPAMSILSPFKVPCTSVRMFHKPLMGRVLDVDSDGNADHVHTCARDVLHILWGDQERPFEQYSTIVAENFSPIAGARIITSFAIIDDALMVVRQDLSLVGGLVRNTYDLLVCDAQHLKEHRTQVEAVSVDTCLAPDNGEFGLMTLYSDSLLWIGTAEPGSRYLLRASRHAIDLHHMDSSIPALLDTADGSALAYVSTSTAFRVGADNPRQLVVDYDQRIFASERDLLFHTKLSDLRTTSPYDWTSIECELLEVASFDPLRLRRVPITTFDAKRRPIGGFRVPDLDGDGQEDMVIGFGKSGFLEPNDRAAVYLTRDRP